MAPSNSAVVRDGCASALRASSSAATTRTLGVRIVPRRATTVLAAVAIAAILNYFLAGFAGDVVFNVGREVIAFLGGWLMVSSANRGLWMAALTGPGCSSWTM